MQEHVQLTKAQPRRVAYLRFNARSGGTVQGCAAVLSSTATGDPFLSSQVQIQRETPLGAQYQALLLGLVQALKHGVADIHIYGYNDTVVKQVRYGRCPSTLASRSSRPLLPL